MIYYLSPSSPQNISGGTRKLYDHVALLNQNGFPAKMLHGVDLHESFTTEDVLVIPEVYGDYLRTLATGIPRISFVQNSYLVDGLHGFGVADPIDNHPFLTTPELGAVFVESQHTHDRMRVRFPTLPVPLIRIHTSANSRDGHHAGFHYGEWPRAKEIIYFDYKHEADNEAIFA